MKTVEDKKRGTRIWQRTATWVQSHTHPIGRTHIPSLVSLREDPMHSAPTESSFNTSVLRRSRSARNTSVLCGRFRNSQPLRDLFRTPTPPSNLCSFSETHQFHTGTSVMTLCHRSLKVFAGDRARHRALQQYFLQRQCPCFT